MAFMFGVLPMLFLSPILAPLAWLEDAWEWICGLIEPYFSQF